MATCRTRVVWGRRLVVLKVLRSFIEATPICKTMLFVRFC